MTQCRSTQVVFKGIPFLSTLNKKPYSDLQSRSSQWLRGAELARPFPLSSCSVLVPVHCVGSLHKISHFRGIWYKPRLNVPDYSSQLTRYLKANRLSSWASDSPCWGSSPVSLLSCSLTICPLAAAALRLMLLTVQDPGWDPGVGRKYTTM